MKVIFELIHINLYIFSKLYWTTSSLHLLRDFQITTTKVYYLVNLVSKIANVYLKRLPWFLPRAILLSFGQYNHVYLHSNHMLAFGFFVTIALVLWFSAHLYFLVLHYWRYILLENIHKRSFKYENSCKLLQNIPDRPK